MESYLVLPSFFLGSVVKKKATLVPFFANIETQFWLAAQLQPIRGLDKEMFRLTFRIFIIEPTQFSLFFFEQT